MKRQILLRASGYVAVALILNGLIFSLGWNDTGVTRQATPPWFAPPGWVIGAIWTLLFAGMGAADVLLSARLPGAGRARLVGRLLAFDCLAYTFYALATDSVWAGFAGNIGTVLLAATAALLARPHDRRAAALLGLVALWSAYATSIVVYRLAGAGQ
jgi:tryptophan-rich sensory protein